jgi:hypothetical protein
LIVAIDLHHADRGSVRFWGLIGRWSDRNARVPARFRLEIFPGRSMCPDNVLHVMSRHSHLIRKLLTGLVVSKRKLDRTVEIFQLSEGNNSGIVY